MTDRFLVLLPAAFLSATFLGPTIHAYGARPEQGAQAGDAARRGRSAAAAQAMSAGRFDEAARIYRELLETSPDEAGLLMNLGMALAMGGREPEAIAPLERAIALDRGLVPAHLFLGSSYLAVDQPAKAIPPLERAAAARPSDIEHRRMLAQAHVAAGRATDALTHLRKITEIAPKLPGGWVRAGACLQRTRAGRAEHVRD